MSKPTDDQYKLYEKARKRTKQKKGVLSHFIFFLIGAVFLVILNKVIKFHPETDWFVWAILVWFFLFILHVINVYVTNKFMNKDWERKQTEKLVLKQELKIDRINMSAKFKISSVLFS